MRNEIFARFLHIYRQTWGQTGCCMAVNAVAIPNSSYMLDVSIFIQGYGAKMDANSQTFSSNAVDSCLQHVPGTLQLLVGL